MQNKITKIKTGSSFYSVKYMKEVRSEKNTILMGQTDPDNEIIEISTDVPYFIQLKVLHHEGTHTVFSEYDLYGSKDKDVRENEVASFSRAFLAFIIDNPEFIKQILKYAERMKK